MFARTRILLCCLFCALQLQAQQFPALHYTQENGLPSNMVYSIFQDTGGRMWFATDKGVAHYNGLEFKHFSVEDGLPDNEIFFFTKDHEGRLWMGTYNGELVYYKNGVFHTAKNTAFLRYRGKEHMVSMTTEPDGSLLIVFVDRRSFINIVHDRVNEYRIPEHPPATAYFTNDIIRHIRKRQGVFSIVYGDYMLRMDTGNCILSSTPVRKNVSMLINGMSHDASGKLYDTNGHFIRQLPDIFSNYNRLNSYSFLNGHLFLCTNYGLWMDHTLLFKGQRVSCVLQDNNHNYWVSTLKNGVYKLPEHFSQSMYMDKAYTSIMAHAFTEGDHIVAGTTAMDLYRLKDNKLTGIFNYGDAFSNSIPPVDYAILPYQNNYYLITLGYIFKCSPGNYKHSWFVPVNIATVKNIINVHNQRLFFHQPSSVGTLTPAEFLSFPVSERNHKAHSGKYDNMYLYGHTLKGSDTTAKKYQLCLAPDSSVWYSATDNFYKIAADSAIRQSQLNGISFRKMIFCKDYLVGVDDRNKMTIIKNYNGAQPLRDSSVRNNAIWDHFYYLTDSSILVSSNNYYRILTLRAGPHINYSLTVLEYAFIPQRAEQVCSDGKTCYFFKHGSVTGIPVTDLITPPSLPVLRFTTISTGTEKLPADTLISLGYKESRDITVYYTAFSFNTTAISFQYSISATDQPDNWTSSDESRINLFNIASGDYILKIRAQTFGGRYSAVKTMQLRVGRPFWLSWWFFALLITGTALIVFLVVRSVLRIRLVQKEKENKFLRSEFTALNALMNPHFVFNSLNSVQSLINKEDLKSANQYVRTISDLLRQNMHNISRELIPLQKEMELIDNYLKLEQLRFKERLQYIIIISEDVDEEFIMIPPLLVQPLVENAIKYTLAFSEISTGPIIIDIYNRQEWTIIDVTDNGQGLTKIHEDPSHESTALINISKRLEQLSHIHRKSYQLSITELRDAAGNITGTRASVSIEN